MIKALIQNDGNTLLLDIPYRRTELCDKLGSIGIWNPQGDIFIRDCENEKISVKLYGETDFDNRLISLFDEDTPLSLANTVCDILHGMDQDQRDQINYDLAHGEYYSKGTFAGSTRDENAEAQCQLLLSARNKYYR